MEEEMRWSLNRARFSPPGENARLGIAAAVPNGPIHPLAPHWRLLEAARYHSEDMALTDTFQHQSPAGSRRYAPGSEPWDRGEAEGYDWVFFGENIAAGYLTGREAHDAWYRSAPHRVNSLDTNFFEVGHGYAEYQPSTYARYYTQDFGSWLSSETHVFTDTIFNDLNSDGVYGQGEGVGGVEVYLKTNGVLCGSYDRSSPCGSFAVQIKTIADNAAVEVSLVNRSGTGVRLSVPVDYDRLLALTLSNGQSLAYGTFQQPAGRANVGFRSVTPYALMPAVRLPVSFPGRWIAVTVWDAAAGAWFVNENKYAPTSVAIRNVLGGRWYLLGLWDYSEGRWVLQEWFTRM
jgi:hypothetical protein